jgi:hypothetical protein
MERHKLQLRRRGIDRCADGDRLPGVHTCGHSSPLDRSCAARCAPLVECSAVSVLLWRAELSACAAARG